MEDILYDTCRNCGVEIPSAELCDECAYTPEELERIRTEITDIQNYFDVG